jgi:very-short-patch-repair endonuclease
MTEIAGFDLLDLKRLMLDGYVLQTTPPQPFDSWFEVDVFIRIAERGYRVIPQVSMNGYKIDLIVEGLAGRMAVECDGDFWHGPDRFDSDMARQRDLERCGMKFWRVRGSSFYRAPDQSLEELWRTLESNKIYPSEHAQARAIVV